MFDWTLSLGTLLHISTVIVAVIIAYGALKSDVKILSVEFQGIQKRQDALNESFKQLSSILTQVAVQSARLTMLEKRIEELSHGKGFVNK